MSKDLELKKDIFPEVTNTSMNDLLSYLPEHKAMLENIQKSLPEITRASSLFYKTQSQFMDNVLVISHFTPIRNARQMLSEMTRTRDALKEAYFGMAKKEVEIEKKQHQLELEENEFNRKLLIIEIAELKSQNESTNGYVSGAIRKLANSTELYNNFVEFHNIKDFTEEDFEKEEEAYHIAKAFEQGISAARARGGTIDEGNMIYFQQIGINGSAAQFYVNQLLNAEQELLRQGKEPNHEMTVDFLQNMVSKFQGCANKFVSKKGLKTYTESALLKEGDTRLLKKES